MSATFLSHRINVNLSLNILKLHIESIDLVLEELAIFLGIIVKDSIQEDINALNLMILLL